MNWRKTHKNKGRDTNISQKGFRERRRGLERTQKVLVLVYFYMTVTHRHTLMERCKNIYSLRRRKQKSKESDTGDRGAEVLAQIQLSNVHINSVLPSCSLSFFYFKKKQQQFGAPVRRKDHQKYKLMVLRFFQNTPAPTPRNKINWVLKTVIDRCRFAS